MSGKEAFMIWAPRGALWIDWARPVPFITYKYDSRGLSQIGVPPIVYADTLEKNCALFIDLPDYYGVEEGLALAKINWRPIPLYNGCDPQAGVTAIVDNRDIEAALFAAAEKLKDIALPKNAPPAFLLDSNRMHRYKTSVSIFDNSWDLYGQDVPSASYFLKQGINKIVLRSAKINKDLKPIFYKYQNAGIKIYFTDGLGYAKEISIRKPLRKD